MNILERYRPEVQPLDPEWSDATLRNIFKSAEYPTVMARPGVRRRIFASVAAAAAAGVAVVAGSLGTSAAFAVEQQGNGDLRVSIYRLTDSSGLEKALGARGIGADVTYVRTALPSDLDDGSSCTGGQPVGVVVEPDDGGFAVTFERSYLESHQGSELSLTAAGGASSGDWSGMKIEWSDGRC